MGNVTRLYIFHLDSGRFTRKPQYSSDRSSRCLDRPSSTHRYHPKSRERFAGHVETVQNCSSEKHRGFQATNGSRRRACVPGGRFSDGRLFVTSARGSKDGSRLLSLRAGTLAVEAEAVLPKDEKGEQIGVFGIGVDNVHEHVWTTNTLAGTVTVYDAKTLSVVKVFPGGGCPASTRCDY